MVQSMPSLTLPLHRGLVQIVHRRDFVMRRFVILLQIRLLRACDNNGISRTSEAREQPHVEAVRPGDIGPDQLTLPNHDRSIKFAIIGDSGRGDRPQHEIAAQMAAYRPRFDYTVVLMAGDNISEGPRAAER